jgi:hypothetical protein
MADRHLAGWANQALKISVSTDKGQKKQKAFIRSPCSTLWKPYEIYTEVEISMGGGYEMSP